MNSTPTPQVLLVSADEQLLEGGHTLGPHGTAETLIELIGSTGDADLHVVFFASGPEAWRLVTEAANFIVNAPDSHVNRIKLTLFSDWRDGISEGLTVSELWACNAWDGNIADSRHIKLSVVTSGYANAPMYYRLVSTVLGLYSDFTEISPFDEEPSADLLKILTEWCMNPDPRLPVRKVVYVWRGPASMKLRRTTFRPARYADRSVASCHMS